MALKGIAFTKRCPLIARTYLLFPAWLKLGLRKRLASAAVGASRFRRNGRPVAQPGEGRKDPAPVPRIAEEPHPEGVNLIGYVRGQFGIAENVRSYARALADGEVPFSLMDLGVPVPGQSEDHSLLGLVTGRPVHPVNMHLYNADQVELARDALDEGTFRGRVNIGFWLWELSRFPQAWVGAAEPFDEFWVPSRFIHDALVQVTDKPVVRIPKAIEFEPPAGMGREHFGLEPEPFTFLFSYDCHSYPHRKNPAAVVSAFRHAFPGDRDDVRLLIKSSHGDRFPEHQADMAIAISGDPRIYMWDEVVQREDMYALLACVDAYVSLHRSEGFGLGMAESMYLGKPVIATGYSGNMDFMNEDNACLVGYDLVPVKEGEYPHADGQEWAEPHIEAAAAHMQALVADPGLRARLGTAAAQAIRSSYSRARAADAIRQRVREIRAGHRGDA